MITQITYPTTEEEWFAKGNATSPDGIDVYFEVPGVFVDGVLDQSATELRVQEHVDMILKRLKNEGNT